MKIGDNMKAWLIASGIVLLMAILFFALPGGEEVPEVDWHLQFHVSNKSDAGIAGAQVRVRAMGKITALNKVFRIRQKTREFNGITDAHGDYRLDLRACELYVTFSKDGYEDNRTDFHGTSDPTNTSQSLNITMEHK
jgi:hypothetical protein